MLRAILGLLFYFLITNSFAVVNNQVDSTQLLLKPVQAASTACSFSFVDSYAGTSPGTNPPTLPHWEAGWNNMGNSGSTPPLDLQFTNNGTPTRTTPPVPCTGYYEVSFSLSLRNNEGPYCNEGSVTLSVWSLTTDMLSPNAYGCQVKYWNWNHTSWIPSGSWPTYTYGPERCNAFTQWVQCLWANNVDYWAEVSGYNFISTYNIACCPIFTYTGWWRFQQHVWLPAYYSNMWGGSGSGLLYPGYIRNNYTNYCSQKPTFYKNVVLIHKGAQITAPSLQGFFSGYAFQYKC